VRALQNAEFRGEDMFWRKKTPNAETPPWDDNTLKRVSKVEQFNVDITSITRTVRFGGPIIGRQSNKLKRDDEYEIYGFMKYPKFIPVKIYFFPDFCADEHIGVWFYHLYGSLPPDRAMPFLELHIHDTDSEIRSLFFQAHHAALLSGKRRSSVRFFKRKGDGVMTEKERQDQWSSESRYPLLSAVSWVELESERLPRWAYPFSDERFSAKGMPAWYDLKL